MNTKQRISQILEISTVGDLPSKIFDIFISSLILLNIVAVILDSVEKLSVQFGELFYYFEIFSVIIFSIEYILRLWTCTVKESYSRPIAGRIKYALTFFLIIDLLAIIPFYLPMVLVFDLRIMRVVRLLRLIRIFKFTRYSESMQIFMIVLRKKTGELLMVIFIAIIILVIASSLMFYIEGKVQPDMFTNIPSAMWWSVVTLTTVGHGDMCPVTLLGKVLAAFIATLGIGLFALPAGIFGSGFMEELQRRKRSPRKCPHCGREVD